MKGICMTMLPTNITERLKTAGANAYKIRMGDPTRQHHSATYQFWIEEIDAITADAKRTAPHLYKPGA